jgi:hypothetical protein
VSEKKGQYTWENKQDAEIWYNDRFDTIEECIKDARKNGVEPGTMIAIGLCEDYTPVINVDDVLERVGEDAYEEVGEVAEGWPAFKSKEGFIGSGSLEEKLNKVFNEWLEETNQVPGFYKIHPLADMVEVTE